MNFIVKAVDVHFLTVGHELKQDVLFVKATEGLNLKRSGNECISTVLFVGVRWKTKAFVTVVKTIIVIGFIR